MNATTVTELTRTRNQARAWLIESTLTAGKLVADLVISGPFAPEALPVDMRDAGWVVVRAREALAKAQTDLDAAVRS